MQKRKPSIPKAITLDALADILNEAQGDSSVIISRVAEVTGLNLEERGDWWRRIHYDPFYLRHHADGTVSLRRIRG